MSGWRMAERFLGAVLVVLVVVTAYRLATRTPVGNPADPLGLGPEPALRAPVARPGAGATTSPAGAELLTRIRATSERELGAVVDKLSGGDAFKMYAQLTASDRQAVLSALPAPILARKIHALLGIPEATIQEAARPGVLVASLIEVALTNSQEPQGTKPGTLGFTTTLDVQENPEGLRSTFKPDERKIHACLDGAAGSDLVSGVLVRWAAEGLTTPLYLHYLPLIPGRRWNYVYFESAVPWTPGIYRVSFYRIGETAGLMAEGTYTVANGG